MASRIDFNRGGFEALLRSPEVVADLERRAEAIAAAAGGAPDFGSKVFQGKDRARAVIFTASYDGMRDEATDRVLTRALDAGR